MESRLALAGVAEPAPVRVGLIPSLEVGPERSVTCLWPGKRLYGKAHRCRLGSSGGTAMGLRPACSRIIYDYTHTHRPALGWWERDILHCRQLAIILSHRVSRWPQQTWSPYRRPSGWTGWVDRACAHTLTPCSIIEVLWLHVLLPPLFGTLFYITICICS